MTKNTEQDPYRTGQTVENGRPICGARKKNDDPCGASPAKGHTRCWRHGGASPRSKTAAKRRNMEADAREILGKLDQDIPRKHPVEHLLDLIHTQAREVEYWQVLVKELREDELMWTKAEHQEGFGPMGMVNVTTHKAEQNPLLEKYEEAKDKLEKYSTAAAKAGVEERAIKIAENQAEIFITGINRILAQLGLTAEQQKLIPQVVPAVLREIGEGQAA